GLLPYRAAGTAVQGPDRTVPVGHQHPVDRQPRTAGTAAVAGPDRTPAGGIDGHGGLLVAAGVEHGAVEHRSAVDVGHAVEFGATVGLRDRQVPQFAAVGQGHRGDGAVVVAHE